MACRGQDSLCETKISWFLLFFLKVIAKASRVIKVSQYGDVNCQDRKTFFTLLNDEHACQQVDNNHFKAFCEDGQIYVELFPTLDCSGPGNKMPDLLREGQCGADEFQVYSSSDYKCISTDFENDLNASQPCGVINMTVQLTLLSCLIVFY